MQVVTNIEDGSALSAHWCAICTKFYDDNDYDESIPKLGLLDDLDYSSYREYIKQGGDKPQFLMSTAQGKKLLSNKLKSDHEQYERSC